MTPLEAQFLKKCDKDNSEIESLITPGTSGAGLIESAAVIVWDELALANVATERGCGNL